MRRGCRTRGLGCRPGWSAPRAPPPPQESVRHDRIDEVIEPEMTRAFYVQVADDDLTDGPPPA